MTMSTNHARRQFLPKSHVHSTKSLTKIKENRVHKLEALARREDTNGKRSRVEGILTQKMLQQFGSRQPNAPVNDLIVETVHKELPPNTANANQRVVAHLEEKVAEAIDHACQTGELQRRQAGLQDQHSRSNSTSNSRRNSREGAPGAGPGGADGDRPPVLDIDALKQQMSSDWSLLDAYSAFESEERERLKQEKKQQQKDMMVAELAAQRDEKMRRQQREKEEAKQFQIEQKKRFEQWRIEDEEHQEKLKQKVAEEKEARRLVVEARQAMAERARQDAMREAEREMQRVKRELEAEKEQQRVAVQREKDRLERIMLENIENKRAREEAKHKQWQEDQKMMLEYKAKLDREEVLRKNAFKAREEKLKTMGAAFAKDGAGAKQAEIERREREIVEAEYRKKVQADEDRERRDLKKLEQSKRLIARDNALLLEEKAKRREADAQEAHRIFLMASKEAQKFEDRERNKIKQRRLASQEHQRQLQGQITAHRQKRKNLNMSETERKLNADRIRMVEKNPDLLLSVLNHAAPATGRSGFSQNSRK